ncbi:precorrin-8X methylmutase [Halorhodospira halophila]|uniref:Precorrin-8X methylmutase n=1 Tax=Halorhodospira halophila (strain DSM 244 / SL1) TaxID=349124 RepID=A1WWQ4_HALHL|nr:precorrin-8X methylmutase [Halorhodospira halophila]ABM62116.1 precorrin-8X methylmutase [Halorhodospira halophila SL1]MBK1729444.1 precorrin-8X methylmutase [Halorhodospira halophila]
MSREPSVTEQQTASGRQIEACSFARVDAEAGDRSAYDAAQWAVVRRMIHATADFDFNGVTRFHPRAVTAGMEAIRAGAPVFVDVEMIRVGLSAARLGHFGIEAHCLMADPRAAERAQQAGTTRAEQAVALAAEQGWLDGAIVAVGNAPTALRAVLERIHGGVVAPRLLIAMPVGFVAAAESSEEAMAQQQVPWIATAGRKGGTPPVVACLHALLALAEEGDG